MRQDTNIEISSIEFELLVKTYLDGLSGLLCTYNSTHDKKIRAYDGEYQIDIYAEFEYLNVRFKVIVECKHHKNKIKREVIQVLNDKVKSLGAQKGIIFSSSGFQKGAIEYAKLHGIALVSIMDGKLSYFSRFDGDLDMKNYPFELFDIPAYIGELELKNTIYFLNEKNLEGLNKFIFENP